MSLAERVLKFSFSGAESGDFSAAGLRAAVSIQGSYGRLGTQAQVRIWGLSLEQMNAYSSKLPNAVGGTVGNFSLAIDAGDLGGQMANVVNANIWASYIDLTGSPDSTFVVSVAGIYTAANPMAPQSQPGAQNAEDLIRSICNGAGFALHNDNGAHAVLRNQSTYGSALDQIERIAQAAGFSWMWDGGTQFYIWPGNGTIDDTIVQVGPNTDPQMVNYPQYYPQGIIVTSLFNPEIKLGRQMEVVGSVLTKANGIWQIVGVQHDLTTMMNRGPWFTTAMLSAPP